MYGRELKFCQKLYKCQVLLLFWGGLQEVRKAEDTDPTLFVLKVTMYPQTQND